jgi:hypothetical protein
MIRQRHFQALCLLFIACHVSGSAVPNFSLSAGFSSDMVLQRAPAKAALFGFGAGMVSVTVKGTDGSGSAVSYTVSTQANAENIWKVFLKPADKGGDYTISALNSESTVVLERVTFGDIYLCSGQSNSKSVSIPTSG